MVPVSPYTLPIQAHYGEKELMIVEIAGFQPSKGRQGGQVESYMHTHVHVYIYFVYEYAVVVFIAGPICVVNASLTLDDHSTVKPDTSNNPPGCPSLKPESPGHPPGWMHRESAYEINILLKDMPLTLLPSSLSLFLPYIHTYIHTYIYMCVCVRVCGYTQKIA